MRKLRRRNQLAQSHQASKLKHKSWFLCCQSPVFLTGRPPDSQVPGPLRDSSSVWEWSVCWCVWDTFCLWRLQGWDPERKLGLDFRLLRRRRVEIMVISSLFYFPPGYLESSLGLIRREGFRRALCGTKNCFWLWLSLCHDSLEQTYFNVGTQGYRVLMVWELLI